MEGNMVFITSFPNTKEKSKAETKKRRRNR